MRFACTSTVHSLNKPICSFTHTYNTTILYLDMSHLRAVQLQYTSLIHENKLSVIRLKQKKKEEKTDLHVFSQITLF